jgi:dienelactone hydrolase
MRGPPEERAVTFASGEVLLAGILSPPVAGAALRGLGIVLVPGGLTRRVGLHRLYVEAARALCSAGASVLRFDPPGVGESEGGVARVTAAGLASLDAWYAAEIRAAVDCVEREASPDATVLVGHCNGARSAVVAAAGDPRVGGVAAWAMPLGSDTDPAPAAELDQAIRRISERAIPVLWTFGTRDPAWTGFRAYVEGRASRSPDGHEGWTVRTVTSANHDFTGVAWTRELIEGTLAWMLESKARLTARSERDGLRTDP